MLDYCSKRWLSLEPLENEEWKPIEGFEGLYEISNMGRVKRLPYSIQTTNPKNKNVKYDRHFKGGIIKGSISNNGYRRVTISKNAKLYYYHVHSLVAHAFIPNPEDLPCINHKNEDKTDSRVSNLEWCSYEYNNKYNNLLSRSSATRHNFYSRQIRLTSIDGKTIKDFPSQFEAAKYLHTTKEMILRTARKERKTCRGYIIDFINS